MSTSVSRGPLAIWCTNATSLAILRIPTIFVAAITGAIVALLLPALDVQPSFAAPLAGCSVVVAGIAHTGMRMLLRYFGREGQMAICISIVSSQLLVSGTLLAAASLEPLPGFAGGVIVGAVVAAAELVRVAKSKAPVDLLPRGNKGRKPQTRQAPSKPKIGDKSSESNRNTAPGRQVA